MQNVNNNFPQPIETKIAGITPKFHGIPRWPPHLLALFVPLCSCCLLCEKHTLAALDLPKCLCVSFCAVFVSFLLLDACFSCCSCCFCGFLMSMVLLLLLFFRCCLCHYLPCFCCFCCFCCWVAAAAAGGFLLLLRVLPNRQPKNESLPASMTFQNVFAAFSVICAAVLLLFVQLAASCTACCCCCILLMFCVICFVCCF